MLDERFLGRATRALVFNDYYRTTTEIVLNGS